MTHTAQLNARRLHIHTPVGRALFQDLELSLNDGDRVAIVGRNGTGKTTLLRVLAGETQATRGRVSCTGTRVFVPQLISELSISPGEQRRQTLEQAFSREPNFLLLDEPSLDLDQAGVDWLLGALRRYRGACLLVTHDRRLLRLFNDFFVISEAGCNHHHGTFDSLVVATTEEQTHRENKYVQQLTQHVEQEAQHVRIARRRERKKNLGRVHELKRCPARAQLNGKRGYAQKYQARRAKLQDARIGAARDWVKALRRSITVQLPLEFTLPELLPQNPRPVIDARAVTIAAAHETTTPLIDLSISRERWAIRGPNGCGKSTLLQVLLGERARAGGSLKTDLHRLGYIAQNAANWQKPECLLEHLCFTAADLPRASQLISTHRFPLALAQRSLDTLSPGERVRAALLALFARSPGVELLVLDEPTNHLDLMAMVELERILRAWPGGLLVVSHDREFLRNIGIQHELSFEAHGWQARTTV